MASNEDIRAVWYALEKQMAITDSNRDGKLSSEEFRIYSRANGMSEVFSGLYFNKIDRNYDSSLSKGEFMEGLIRYMTKDQIEELAKESREPDFETKQAEKLKKVREEIIAEDQELYS